MTIVDANGYGLDKGKAKLGLGLELELELGLELKLGFGEFGLEVLDGVGGGVVGVNGRSTFLFGSGGRTLGTPTPVPAPVLLLELALKLELAGGSTVDVWAGTSTGNGYGRTGVEGIAKAESGAAGNGSEV
jgi:hypothetical protein